MEIKVGEYVRTDKGYIVKIDEEKKNLQMLKFLDVEYGNIVKHSKNIIDLIEVGDYVNGEKIEKIKRTEEKLYIEWENEDYIDLLLIDFEAVKTINKLIKTIVTKEQFSSLEYII